MPVIYSLEGQALGGSPEVKHSKTSLAELA